jgi:hypothetical protein
LLGTNKGEGSKKLLIAFWCWLEGKYTKPAEFWRNMPDDATEKILGYTVRRNRIPDYNTSEFRDWVTAWNIWEAKHLLPFAGAWTEQPAHVVDVLTALDGAHGKFVDREMRRKKAQREAKGMKKGRR